MCGCLITVAAMPLWPLWPLWPMMRDTTWNGKVWKMYYLDKGMKVAKGMKMVLEERGISTAGKTGDWMRKTLGEHSDFRDD